LEGLNVEGWVKLYRKILESDMYQNLNSKQKVIMLTCLLLASHRENKWEYKGEIYTVKPGQFVTSLESLSKQCGNDISVRNVRTALSKLETWGFLTQQTTKAGRLITIVNWHNYQDSEEKTDKDSDKEVTKSRQRSDKEVTTIKNEKNDNNEKNNKNKKIYIQYAEFVKMTEDEYNKLVTKYGEKKVKRMIEVLDNYKGATGKKYKSDYRAILNWVADKVLKEKDDDDEWKITDEEMEILLEKRQQLEEEKKKRMEEFNKLTKEEQDHYIDMAKKFITGNIGKKERGVYWIGDYLKEGAK